MSIPPKIEFINAKWSSSREDQAIQCIIAHDTETPNKPGATSKNYLQRGGDRTDGSDRKVSIHVWIDKNGDSVSMVHDTLAANHAGFGTLIINGKKYGPRDAGYAHSVNTCSLGFELEHTVGSTEPYPEAQLLSAGYWIATWRQRWGNIPLLAHRDVDPKRRTDPIHLSLETLEKYTNKAAELLYEVPTPEKPVKYLLTVPQVVYTARSLSSRFAGTPLVLNANEPVMIGDITGDWAWIANGSGFIPLGTITKAK